MRVRSSHRRTLEGQACRIHAWACPVLMKTDPDHVAWTCAHCGAVAVAAIGERPALAAQASAIRTPTKAA